jgi:A/G-specific adenine glycosylase
MGAWPRTAPELQKIEGIGPFTAAIIASFAFGEVSAAIDVNVIRVLSRLSGSVEMLPERSLTALADKLCSPRSPARWNQAMMDLGAVVCTSRKPKCDACPIARWCRARPLFAGAPATLVAEDRLAYRTKPAFAGSTRYYRGRIVQVLRELPEGRSLTTRQLLDCIDGRGSLDIGQLRVLVDALRRDGLVQLERGRVRLP